MKLPIHTAGTAAIQSRLIFEAISQARGFVPNVYTVYGGLQDAMNGFASLTGAFGAGSLTHCRARNNSIGCERRQPMPILRYWPLGFCSGRRPR